MIVTVIVTETGAERDSIVTETGGGTVSVGVSITCWLLSGCQSCLSLQI